MSEKQLWNPWRWVFGKVENGRSSLLSLSNLKSSFYIPLSMHDEYMQACEEIVLPQEARQHHLQQQAFLPTMARMGVFRDKPVLSGELIIYCALSQLQ
jgi:hypothetical protein